MKMVYNLFGEIIMKYILALIIFIIFTSSASADRHILKFTADWCRYCRVVDHFLIQKEFATVVQSYENLIIVDVDKYPKVAKSYRASSLPLLVIVDNVADTKKIKIISRWVPAYKTTEHKNRISLLNWLKQYSPKKQKNP